MITILDLNLESVKPNLEQIIVNFSWGCNTVVSNKLVVLLNVVIACWFMIVEFLKEKITPKFWVNIPWQLW